MSSGQPLTIRQILPSGMAVDDFYVLLAACAAFSVVFLVGRSFMERDTLAPRIKAMQERRKTMKDALISPRRRKSKHLPEEPIHLIKKIVMKLKLLPGERVAELNRQLICAGYRSKDAKYIVAFAKTVAPLLLFALAFGLVKIDFTNLMSNGWRLFVPVAMGYAGLKLPDLLIANARGKRYKKLQKSLPDTLDLMTICAEAGLSLAATVDRVSKELRLSYPEMADELALTALEMGLLPDRMKAMHHLGERVEIPEVRGIVSVLVQTEKYGTPVSQALRVLSAEFREQRMLRAEQKAAKLPAIMTVPMIVFILPTLFVVVITPAIIKVLDTMAQ